MVLRPRAILRTTTLNETSAFLSVRIHFLYRDLSLHHNLCVKMRHLIITHSSRSYEKQTIVFVGTDTLCVYLNKN